MKYGDQFLAQLLIPINLNKLKREDELHIYDAYRVDLQTQQEFSFEVKRWKARWELYPTDQVNPSHLCEALERVKKKLVFRMLNILLTMLPSTATDERSFSVLKRVKTYFLSTMGQERLSPLSLLSSYSQTHSVSIGCSRGQV